MTPHIGPAAHYIYLSHHIPVCTFFLPSTCTEAMRLPEASKQLLFEQLSMGRKWMNYRAETAIWIWQQQDPYQR